MRLPLVAAAVLALGATTAQAAPPQASCTGRWYAKGTRQTTAAFLEVTRDGPENYDWEVRFADMGRDFGWGNRTGKGSTGLFLKSADANGTHMLNLCTATTAVLSIGEQKFRLVRVSRIIRFKGD